MLAIFLFFNDQVITSNKGKAIGDADSLAILQYYTPSIVGDIGDIPGINKFDNETHFVCNIRGKGPHFTNYIYDTCVYNSNPVRFTGGIFLNPDANFGMVPKGGYDLRKILGKLTWETACEGADSLTIEFCIGGSPLTWNKDGTNQIIPEYPCSLPELRLGVFTISPEWKYFEYDLSKIPRESFRRVVKSFCWIYVWGSNGVETDEAGRMPLQNRQFTIKLRNVYYKK